MLQYIGKNVVDVAQSTKKYLESIRTKSRWLPPKWLRLLIVIVLVIGVFFRFVNLDRKVYSVAETYTSLRISGYTEAELVQQVSHSQIIGIKELQKYQQTNSEKNYIDTIKSLAKEEPQLTPLYFLIARFWVETFGNSVAVTRSLSAFISLLVFPAIYWLCIELFKSPLTGWLAIALIAVSPFHVLYAQEARPYSLWEVCILVSSALLLRAMRLNTLRSWCIYAVSLAIGFYSFLYFMLVALGHGIYVVVTKGLRGSQIKAYLFASLAGFITFLPWLAIVIINKRSIVHKTSWQGEKTSLSFLVKNWMANISYNFIDFDLNRDNVPLIHLIPFVAIVLILMAILLYSTYFLYRNTSKQTWFFVLILMVIPTLDLVLQDLIRGGIRSTQGRYWVPFYLCSQLAVAYLFAHKINFNVYSWKGQKRWQIAAVILLSFGILSCSVLSQAEIWWNKYTSSVEIQIADIINSTPKPLLLDSVDANDISYTDIGSLLGLSYLLNPNVKTQLVVEANTPEINGNFSDVFVTSFFDSASNLLERIERKQNLKAQLVLKDGITSLYKIID